MGKLVERRDLGRVGEQMGPATMTSRATEKVMRGGCGVELFLAFPFGCWGIYGKQSQKHKQPKTDRRQVSGEGETVGERR